ncbi:MAG: DUF4382 domain-containing protein [candidate division Zixibacteria bacterium]|nr:DUF4382 domain-containing protein [candidate division Zixibacteria bacterium]
MIRSLFLLMLLALVFIAGCTDKPEGPLTGRFELYVQDALADYDSVYLTIDTIATRSTLETSTWTNIYAGPRTVELTSLRNGNRLLILSRDFQLGRIGGLKVSFGDGRVIVGGVSRELQFMDTVNASGFADGIIVINTDRDTQALIDINLARSISYDAGEDVYRFSPEMTFIDFDSTGSIIGSTEPRANIYLFEHDSTEAYSFTISEFDLNLFGFYGLPEGLYDVLVAPRGSDTLIYDSLFNTDITIFPDTEYDMGLLDLPLLEG